MRPHARPTAAVMPAASAAAGRAARRRACPRCVAVSPIAASTRCALAEAAWCRTTACATAATPATAPAAASSSRPVVSTSVAVSVTARDCSVVEITLISANPARDVGRPTGAARLFTPSVYAPMSAWGCNRTNAAPSTPIPCGCRVGERLRADERRQIPRRPGQADDTDHRDLLFAGESLERSACVERRELVRGQEAKGEAVAEGDIERRGSHRGLVDDDFVGPIGRGESARPTAPARARLRPISRGPRGCSGTRCRELRRAPLHPARHDPARPAEARSPPDRSSASRPACHRR